jgi:hypothetical protein
MSYRRRRSKPDLFAVLLILVVVGMSVTLAYQISVYHGQAELPMARQPALLDDVGG